MARITYIPNRVIDSDGIADGASIYVYQTGTTTLVSLYSDADYTTPVSNPYVVASGAEIPPLYHNFMGDIRLRVESTNGDVRDEDPYDPFVVEETWILAENYGLSTSNTSAQNTEALQNAIDAALAGDAKGVRVPPKEYVCGAITINGVGLTLDLTGATLISDAVDYVRITFGVNSEDVTLLNGTIIQNSAVHMFDIYGTRIKMLGTHFTRDQYYVTGTVGYLRTGCSDILIDGVSTYRTGGQVFAVYGQNITISNFNFVAGTLSSELGDDCIAFKAPNGVVCQNVRIGPGMVRMHAAIISIGSEIGTDGANDSTYSSKVRNVHVHDVLASECMYLSYIKPGGVVDYDYRDGLVEDIFFTGCTLIDREGTRFRSGVSMRYGRGAIVRNVTVSNCLIRARAYNAGSPVRTCGAVDLTLLDMSGINPGINAPSASNIEVDISYEDPYQGAPNSASAPGYPVIHHGEVNISTSGHGSVSDIRLRIKADGCADTGLSIDSDADGEVTVLSGTKLKSVMAAPSGSTIAGIRATGDIEIETPIVITPYLDDWSIDGTVRYPIGGTASGTFGTVTYTGGEEISIPLGTYAAATGTVADMVVPFTCSKDFYIHRIELVNTAAIAADAANYVTIGVNAGANQIASRGTNTASVSAKTPFALHTTECVLDPDALNIAGGTVLSVVITGTGTGQPLTNAFLRIRYIPHGE